MECPLRRLGVGHTDGDFYFHAGRLSPLYTAADRKAWDDGSAFTIKTMWPQLATVTFNDLNKLDIPVILFLGRHDYTTPATIAAAWMDRLKAPKKVTVLVRELSAPAHHRGTWARFRRPFGTCLAAGREKPGH